MVAVLTPCGVPVEGPLPPLDGAAAADGGGTVTFALVGRGEAEAPVRPTDGVRADTSGAATAYVAAAGVRAESGGGCATCVVEWGGGCEGAASGWCGAELLVRGEA